MACDLDKHRRRIRWEKRIRHLCQERASIGFNRAEAISKEWWLEFDEAQTDSDWLWLDGGFVLTEYIPPSPGIYSHLRVNPTPLREIQVTLFGSPVALFYGEGIPWSVQASCVLTVLDIAPPAIEAMVFATTRILGPNVTDFWQFGGWSWFFPPSPLQPPINGRAILTPLDACHQCTPGF